MNLPAWNIESEYPSLNSDEFQKDERRLQILVGEMEKAATRLRPQFDLKSADPRFTGEIQKVLHLNLEAFELLRNLLTYVHCLETIDAKDEAAKGKSSQLQAFSSKFAQSFKPFQLLMSTCDQELFEKIMADPKLQGSLFHWTQERTMRDTLLSEKEETLLAALSTSGHGAWGDLYDAISGTLRVRLEMNGQIEEIGLAQASGLTRSSAEAERKAAWQGIQYAWKEHQESSAAILNALTDWRLQLVEKRSHTRKIDFLTQPLFQNRIQRETLDAMLTAVQNNKKDIQEAALLMAKMHGKSKMDPWDLLAPSPVKATSAKIDFKDGLNLIRTAFAGAHPQFGEFVDLMERNQWMDARVLPNKANGAYCTGFAKSRTPRVFQTYMGSSQDVSTLAHELGHAYHSWVIRDLPLDEQEYPMTLAETASIFAETVLADELIAKSKTKEEKIEFAWADIEGAVSLLLNIPARFEFESQLCSKRAEKSLSPREMSELMDQAWSKWYGDTLSRNDSMFWASKLHFSMAGTSFYNFPYTFGYLFSLSIYARRKELGAAFWPKYIEILRDTGRMTAEDLIQKHLGEDIRKPEFWQKSIDVVHGKIESFKKLL